MANAIPTRCTRLLAWAALVLAVLLVTVSGYIRLTKAGFGCEPWPGCFGQGALSESRGSAEAGSLPGLVHRITATVLGLLVLAIAWRAFFRDGGRSVRLAGALILILTIGLAALGPWSATLAWPAVNFANLVGGVAMVALLGWLAFIHRPALGPGPALKWAIYGGLILVAVQLVLGGLAAAHLAGPACPGLPTCQEAWLPGLERLDWVALWRPLEGDGGGGLSPLAPVLDQLHRLVGVVVAVYGLALAASVARWRAGEGAVLGLLVLIPLGSGIASVLAGFPLGLALLHYLGTVALLLGLVRLGKVARAPGG